MNSKTLSVIYESFSILYLNMFATPVFLIQCLLYPKQSRHHASDQSCNVWSNFEFKCGYKRRMRGVSLPVREA